VRLPEIDPERLLTALRHSSGQPGLTFLERPHLLGSGGEAVVEAFRLAGAPPPLDGPLVVRRLLPLKEPAQVHKEAAVHEALAAQGFPVPRVLHADSDPTPVGAPYLVAERLPGKILLQEMTRPGELAGHPLRIPRLIHQALTSVPRLLGEMQAQLHALDAKALERRLVDAGFDVEKIRFTGRLALLSERIDKHALDGLSAGLEWLRANQPGETRPVICHGDFVFTNVCVEKGRVAGVFDWSNVALAEPAYDVAATLARLKSNVPGLPSLLARITRRVQAGLEKRYLGWYRRNGSVEPTRVQFYEAYWLLHELVWSGERQRAGAVPDEVIEHRWLHRETIARGVHQFEATTGVRLAPLLPGAPT
jgi:aminoglycoside phosphotransferase (APT) family kinase protein